MTSKFELHVIDTAYDTLDIKRKDLWGQGTVQLSQFHIKLKNTWNYPQNTRVHEIVSNIFNTIGSSKKAALLSKKKTAQRSQQLQCLLVDNSWLITSIQLCRSIVKAVY